MPPKKKLEELSPSGIRTRLWRERNSPRIYEDGLRAMEVNEAISSKQIREMRRNIKGASNRVTRVTNHIEGKPVENE